MSNIVMVSASVDGNSTGFTGSGTADNDIWTLDPIDVTDFDGTVSVVVDFDETLVGDGAPFTIVDAGNTAEFGGELIFNEDTGVYTFTFDTDDPDVVFGEQVTFQVGSALGDVDTVIINFVCFTKDTVIKTPDGPRAVQSLSVGDWVLTRDHGPRQIKWTGSRTLGKQELAESPHLRPVRIRAGALGQSQPSKDLTVSPQHKVYLSDPALQLLFGVEEALVPAKGLVDGHTVVESDTDEVTYYHIMFDRHEVVHANGAWSESFYPGATALDSLNDASRNELLELFPELQMPENLWDTAMPVLSTGETRTLVTLKQVNPRTVH